MKKSLWFAALALVAMTSCSNDDVMDVADNKAIEFKSFVNKGTRSEVADVTDTEIKNFWVFGQYDSKGDQSQWVDVFTNVMATGSKTSGWTLEQTAYWEKGKTYDFAAYANGTVKLESGVSFQSTSASDAVLTFNDYTSDGNHDLVAAVATGKSWDGTSSATPDKVELSFKHLLSKVKFTFTTTDSPEAYTFTVSELKIASALTKATGSYNGTASWETTGTTGDYVYDGIDDYAVDGGSASSFHRYVIPQNNSNLYATFTVTAYDAGGNQLATAKFKANLKYTKDQAEDTANDVWTPGFVYNYTAKINYGNIVNPENPETVKPIEFKVDTVQGWDNADGTSSTPESNETQPKP